MFRHRHVCSATGTSYGLERLYVERKRSIHILLNLQAKSVLSDETTQMRRLISALVSFPRFCHDEVLFSKVYVNIVRNNLNIAP